MAEETFYDRYVLLCEEHDLAPISPKTSKLLGITTSTLCEWKRLKNAPRGDKLLIVAKFFDVTIDYLVTGGERRAKKSRISVAEKKQVIFGKSENVTNAQLREVLNFAEWVLTRDEGNV